MKNKILPYALAICAIIIVIMIYWDTSALWKNHYDDSYITYRYAVNLAEHGQLVFNLGARTDAASSFLYTVILAGFYRIGFHDIEMIAFILNMLSIGAIGYFLFCIINLYVRNTFIVFVFSLLGATHGAVSVWAILGMETAFFAALLLAFIYAWLVKKIWLSTFLMLTVCLTRPEGILIPLTLIVMELINRQNYKPISFLEYKKRLYRINSAIIVCLIMVIFYYFKYLYYGSAIPNSVYIKLISNQVAYSRYLSPLYPIGVIIVAVLFDRIKSNIFKYVVIIIMVVQTLYVTNVAKGVTKIIAHQTQITLGIGEYIRDNIDSCQWILSSELGAYAYKAINHRFIDTFGLTSGDVLNAYRHGRNIDAILYKKRPLYVADTFHIVNGEYIKKNNDDFRFLKHPVPASQYLIYGYKPILLFYSDRNIYFMFGEVRTE